MAEEEGRRSRRLAAMRNRGGSNEEEPSKKKNPGRIAYEKMMQQKRIVGALQAEQNAKAAQAQATKITKAAQADMTEAEKLAAYKQTPEYLARQESYATYYEQKEKEKKLASADMTEAEKLAVYKGTEEYQLREKIYEQYYVQQEQVQNTGNKVLSIPAKLLRSTASGVVGVLVIIGIVFLVVAGVYGVFDLTKRHQMPSNAFCNAVGTSADLTYCFNSKARFNFELKHNFEEEEFNKLVDTVYSDINSLDWLRSGYDPARKFYDTPFTNADTDTDYKVCVLDRCDKQSHINYFAQGMYSASAEETLDDALAWTEWWNRRENKHPAEAGELWWTTYGWYYYNQRQDCEDNGTLNSSDYPADWIVYQCK